MRFPSVTRILPLSLAAVIFSVGATWQQSENKAVVLYEEGVEPLFKAHCLSCHSSESKAGGLDLSSLAGLKKGGSSGPAIVAGNSSKSLLVQRIEGQGGKAQMPLGFQGLSTAKIATIKAWVDGGCKSGGPGAMHWSYAPIKRSLAPKVKQTTWVRNPIDQFVLAKLESMGFHPSKEASKNTLIRRLYLDLTGLPPSPEDIHAFLADKSAGAYERVVDRLLASPAYGERMARPWLDLARYADSDGYEKDLNRTAWKYRDWVITAFNRNMPFDQFTIEQLAGDMLPAPTLDQLVATGFNRNSMFNSEGGVDPAEAQFNVVLDRVNTVSTVWLGSTMACARCHDHKYDPFTQTDYYKMYAVFNNTEYTSNGDYKTGQENWYEPTIDVPSQEQVAQNKLLTSKAEALQKKIANPSTEYQHRFESWIDAGCNFGKWEQLGNTQVKSAANTAFKVLDDGSYLAQGTAPANDVYTMTGSIPVSTTAVRIEVLPDPSLPKNGPGRGSSGNFILTRLQVLADGQPVAVKSVQAGFSQGGYDPSSTLHKEGGVGWAVYPNAGKANDLVIEFARPTSRAQNVSVVLEFGSREWPEHEIGRLRLTATSDDVPQTTPFEIRSLLADPAPLQTKREKFRAAFARIDPETKPLVAEFDAVQEQQRKLKLQIPTALVLREKRAGKIEANVHVRGEFLQKGDLVQGGPPVIVSPRPGPNAFTRLELAKWLVSKDNPLTARVEANRLWEILFGRGIVETSEDFGTQGSKPTHPELLDWLASELISNKWNVKALVKLIVTSATYRQSSELTPALLEKDPLNLYFARAPRLRLEAEAVRDNMLAIGGVLSLKVGGPSVYPSQPPAIWDTPYNGEQWMTSNGPDKYRRGLYTFWKRSAPYPTFMAMDATSREVCTVRRLRTNTPLQALALLNDEVTMDAAKGLMKRMNSQHGATIDQQTSYAFEVCTGRVPAVAEAQRLKALYSQLVQRYSKSPDSMKKLAKTPTEAAKVMMCNTLLNLDETITRN